MRGVVDTRCTCLARHEARCPASTSPPHRPLAGNGGKDIEPETDATVSANPTVETVGWFHGYSRLTFSADGTTLDFEEIAYNATVGVLDRIRITQSPAAIAAAAAARAAASGSALWTLAEMAGSTAGRTAAVTTPTATPSIGATPVPGSGGALPPSAPDGGSAAPLSPGAVAAIVLVLLAVVGGAAMYYVIRSRASAPLTSSTTKADRQLHVGATAPAVASAGEGAPHSGARGGFDAATPSVALMPPPIAALPRAPGEGMDGPATAVVNPSRKQFTAGGNGGVVVPGPPGTL